MARVNCNDKNEEKNVMRNFSIALFAVLALNVSAQGISKVSVLPDNTQVISTTMCRYAKASGLFGKSHKIGMSYITFSTRESTYAIILPLSTDHYITMPAGKRAYLTQANGNTMTLENVHNVYREDNNRSLDDKYTIYPEYAVTPEQISTLSMSEVIAIKLETDIPGEFYEVNREDFQREWMFNKYLQQCHNVLVWKLAELGQGH